MNHLYAHIPFCRGRCAYCDFASEPVRAHTRSGRVERYLEALRAELAERGGEATFETIYLGGGTPTVVPSDALLLLVGELAARLERGPDGGSPEFTIEANPGTIDAPLLERMAAAGVTRLSVGVQSFSPALRAALGRRVRQQEIFDALAAVALTGWRDWNLDLVFGIPGQDWDAAAADIDAAVAAGPTHISLYDLTYTPKFADRVGAAFGSGAEAAADAFSEEHYAQAVARLEAAGYRRYEVSNFALPGHECRHNQAYWRGEDYLGIGAAAVSTVGGERRSNPRSVTGYLAGAAPLVERLTPRTRLWEKAMLGLRTAEGVDHYDVRSVLDQAALERLVAQGCLQWAYGRLRLNPGFLDVSNTIIGALLVDPGET
jgi:oxygen-independent coproporphyrinogen-3 oxidase